MLLSCSCRGTSPTYSSGAVGTFAIFFFFLCGVPSEFQHPWNKKMHTSPLTCDPDDIIIITLTSGSVSLVNFIPNLGKTKGKRSIFFCSTAASPRALDFPPRRTEDRGRRSNESWAESRTPPADESEGHRGRGLALRMRCGEARRHLALQSGSLRSAPLASSSVASPPSSTRRPPPASTHRRIASSAPPPAVPTISRLALAAAAATGSAVSALCSRIRDVETELMRVLDLDFGVGRIYRGSRGRRAAPERLGEEAACNAMGMCSPLLTSDWQPHGEQQGLWLSPNIINFIIIIFFWITLDLRILFKYI